MTRSSFDPDLLERRLSESLHRAHDDARWSGVTWTDPVGRLEQVRRRHRRRLVAVSTAGLAVLAAVVGTAAAVLPGSGQDRVQVRAGAPGDGGGTAAKTGLDWLLTPRQYAGYTAAHPSPSPSTDVVPSPAPPDAQLTQLQADIAAALPSGVKTVRADAADGGARGDAAVWLRLADGTPVAVERLRLDYPRVLSTTTGTATTEELAPEHFTDPQTWTDGTAYTVVTGQAWGYGMDEQTQWSGPFVWTVTADGWFTMWTSPVPVDRLVGWAQTADAQFVAAG